MKISISRIDWERRIINSILINAAERFIIDLYVIILNLWFNCRLIEEWQYDISGWDWWRLIEREVFTLSFAPLIEWNWICWMKVGMEDNCFMLSRIVLRLLWRVGNTFSLRLIDVRMAKRKFLMIGDSESIFKSIYNGELNRWCPLSIGKGWTKSLPLMLWKSHAKPYFGKNLKMPIEESLTVMLFKPTKNTKNI